MKKARSVEKIGIPTIVKQEVLCGCHNLSTIGHVGICQTIELVDRQFHWRGMRGDVTSYMKTCPTCQQMKSKNREKVGLLQSLPILSRKWEQVTIDLVTNFPKPEEYTAIVVFIDKLKKMVHFTPYTKEVIVPQYAKLFVEHVFRLHRILEVFISDCDP